MALPIVLVPGLLCTARLYAEQMPTLARMGPVTVADHTRDHPMAAIAERIRGARLVTIADCGHLSTLERPAQVTAALTEWLQA